MRRAIRADGTLLLVEALDSAARPAGFGDLLMLVIGGRDRSETEFRALLAATGFAVARVIATEANSVIECSPV